MFQCSILYFDAWVGGKSKFKILTSDPRSQLKSNPGSNIANLPWNKIWNMNPCSHSHLMPKMFDFPAVAQTCFEFSKLWCWSRFSSFLSCLGFGFEQRIEGDARSRADRHFSGMRSTLAELPCVVNISVTGVPRLLHLQPPCLGSLERGQQRKSSLGY